MKSYLEKLFEVDEMNFLKNPSPLSFLGIIYVFEKYSKPLRIKRELKIPFFLNNLDKKYVKLRWYLEDDVKSPLCEVTLKIEEKYWIIESVYVDPNVRGDIIELLRGKEEILEKISKNLEFEIKGL